MQSKTLAKAALAALSLSLAATGAYALPPLEEDPRVRREFFAAFVGDEIRRNCSSISARFMRVMRLQNKLEDYALGLGYTEADFDALKKNKAAEAEIKAMRDAYLARNGVVKGNSASYCRLGHEEIAKNTLTGWLLRAK